MYKHLCGSRRRDRIEQIARRVAAMVIAVPAAPLAISPAMAQEVAQETASSPETIVVTASKRAESLQTAPLSVTALTGDTLSEHQVTSLDDYVKMLPSVSYQSFGPGQSQVNFRGITTGGDGVAVGPLPTVGVYVDETPVTTIYQALDIHTYDMARIEALSGPQGTLYGASSLSGTLRLITNKPVIGKWEGGVDVGGSKYGPGDVGGSFEGFLNVPINDQMAARVMAFVQHDGGYINNTPVNRTYQRPTGNPVSPSNCPPTYPQVTCAPLTVNNNRFAEDKFNSVDSYGGRAQLKVDLDQNWTLTPALFVQDQLARGTFLFDPHAGDLNVHDFTRDFNRDDWELASLTLQGKVSDWDLSYNAAYLSRRVDNVADYSYFVVGYDSYVGYTYMTDGLGRDIDPTQLVHTYDQYLKQSHELRFSSPADRPWRLTTGAYFQRQIDRHVADYRVHGLATATNAFSPSIPGAPPDDVFYSDLRRVDRDYALFAEGALDITKEITLIGGVRGFVAYNTLGGWSGGEFGLTQAAAALGCPLATATVTNCPNINKSYHETGETHKAELKWQVDPARMLYVIYSTGFRPGGNNRDAFALGKEQKIPPFAADRLSNYEVGWKTSWLDRTLYVNGALFWEEWDKVQYSLPGLLGIYYTLNAGHARAQGIESQVTWKATHHMTLSASGTWVVSRLTTPFCDQVNGCSPPNGRVFAPAGTQLPITPKIKVNGTARYNFAVGQYDAYVQGGVNFQGATLSQLRTDWEQIIGPTTAFATFDLSGGLSMDRYNVTAYLNNMFDRRGILSKNSFCVPNTCGPYERLYPTKPQEFGVKVGYKF
jgi:outer membrane receptor protein involved in Fe transport